MSREEQRQAIRALREGLIAQLEQLYAASFEQLTEHNLGEGGIARLTQLLLLQGPQALLQDRQAVVGGNDDADEHGLSQPLGEQKKRDPAGSLVLAVS